MNAPGDGVLVWIFWNERRSRSRVLFEARNVEGVRRSLKNLADLHIFREGRCLYIKPIQSLSKLPHGTEVPITTNEDDIAILTFEHIESELISHVLRIRHFANADHNVSWQSSLCGSMQSSSLWLRAGQSLDRCRSQYWTSGSAM